MRKSENPKRKKGPEPVRLERRVRVTFFLVAETRKHKEAVLRLIGYLDDQFAHLTMFGRSELPVTGFTHSAIPLETRIKTLEKGIFWGHWWSEEKMELQILESITERVVFFLIDLPAVAEEWKFDENIALLKTRIFEFYEVFQSPQEEIWITRQDIYRYA